jgi:prepilin peptidase CpaA
MLEAATLLFFPTLMVFAAISDLLTMTISNRISIMLVILFIAMAFACGLPARAILWHLACGAAMLILAFGLFTRGWIGGGDAKLAAATAIWLGFDHLGDYVLSASALGGLLTLAIIGLRKLPLPGILLARQWAARLHEPNTGIPYGIALASAGLILYPQTAIWLAAAAAAFH